MTLLVYTLFNNYLGVHDAPQITQSTKEDLCEGLRRSIVLNPDEAFKAHADEKTVCILGEFDDVTGKISLFDNILKVADLSAYFPRGFLAKHQRSFDDAN